VQISKWRNLATLLSTAKKARFQNGRQDGRGSYCIGVHAA